MYTIISGEKVNYGSIDEPVDFNYKDFILRDFFGNEITGLRKKYAVHTFNYIGIIADDFLIGIAAVNLGYLQNVFAYLYSYEDGKVYEYNSKSPLWGPLRFPADPDEYHISFKKGKTSLSIKKSHDKKLLKIDADFEGKLKINGEFPYSLKTHQPLRVLNPSEPTRWTFTEKCSPLSPAKLVMEYNGEPLDFDLARTTAVYDWSGGFLRPETNWYWAAFSGIAGKKTKIGLNLAALVNESFFSENAFWIDGKRTRISRCIYDFNPADPYEPWHIWDEDGKVDITFFPEGERREMVNAVIIKTVFRQFVGTFEGTLRPDKGKAVNFSGIHGFTELHRAKW
ncbi:MAG: DUF2804 domain-containing protein [Spirochaetota bacterium]